MIDIEVNVFDTVYPYLSELVPEGCFTSEYVHEPAGFPHVSLIEIDNTPDKRTRDSGRAEWSSVVTFESNVYAMSKEECRTVQAALDEAMVSLMGFTKTSGLFVPNLADRMIYRITARYERGVTHSGHMYKPT